MPVPTAVLLISPRPLADHPLVAMLGADGAFQIHHCQHTNDATDEAIRVRPAAAVVCGGEGEEAALAAVRRLRADPETEGIPIAYHGPASGAALALEAGANEVLADGLDRAEARRRILALTQSYALRIERNDAIGALQRARHQLRHARQELAEARAQLGMGAGQDGDGVLRQRLSGLLHLGLELGQIQDFHALMDRILAEARSMIGADAGTIFVRESDSLRFAFSQNETLARRTSSGDTPRFSTFRVPLNERSIAGWVAVTGEPVNILDCYEPPADLPYRFDPSFDQMLGYRTTSLLAAPLKNRSGRVLGVLELINAATADGRPRGPFTEEDVALLTHFAGIAGTALERAQLTESIILRMIRMAEIRDPAETGEHVERVAGYASVLFEEWARRRGLHGSDYERQRDRLRIAAKLHDVGKIGVSDAILKKPARLDPAEYEQMKRHAEIGGMLFEEQPTDFDEAAREVAMMHHERWDGTGYPGVEVDGARRGRKGEEIPLFARLVGLADVFDALSSSRSYKEPWPEQRVLEVIESERGRHFDPELVDILLVRIADFRAIRDFGGEL